ncbi:hypothetical protein ACIXKX_18505 [Bacteroides fragilis]|uniref:hypothetical protein n=1 Tax=Bacteroides fragilis TaxID=817 RepID=UPI00189CED14|nr:hypothetical protein [Bacteroides fragilis]
MKKMLLFISIVCFALPALCQVATTTKERCFLFQEYNKNGFNKKKKVDNGKPIILLRKSNNPPNFYIVSFECEQYYLHKNNINPDGVARLEQIEVDSANRRDSIQKEQQEKESMKQKKLTDSIANINKIKDRIAQEKRDSIEKEKRARAFAIIKMYSEEKKALVKAGMPIEVEYLYTDTPNSAGGTSLFFRLKNISPKTIKYISVTGYPINAVKDKCYCSIGRYSQTTRKGVGPIEEGEVAGYTWENTWYNHTIDKFIPVSINIQYMNGSFINITGDKLKKIMEAPLLDKVYNKLLKEYDINLDKILIE